MEFVIIALLAVVLVVEILILTKGKNNGEKEQILNQLGDLKRDQQELRVGVIKEISEGHGKNEKTIRESLIQIQESTEKRLREDSKTVNESILTGLKSIQEANDRKLSDIQQNMDEKLEKNLHTRLDEIGRASCRERV